MEYFNSTTWSGCINVLDESLLLCPRENILQLKYVGIFSMMGQNMLFDNYL